MCIGRITPKSQESDRSPELKIKLKKATYNDIISCAVALIYSLIIPLFEHALLFFKLLIHFKIIFLKYDNLKFHRQMKLKTWLEARLLYSVLFTVESLSLLYLPVIS